MSKTAKKLLSVVLAVLVLAAGFSTMLGSFVMAESEWTYDYQALIPEYVGTDRDRELLKHNLQLSDGSVLAPEELGFYDIVSVATNARNGGSGIWNEGNDANGNPGTVVTDTMGLRVSDTFFLNGNDNRWYVTNAENIDDARAYVTYEVKAGSEFSIQYLTYTETQWANMNLSAEELRLLEIFVSADGVNWVPANVENDIVYDAVKGSNYDRVTATVANVGADTRFVKVQFPANPHTVTYKVENGEWVKSYYPQEGWFLQKVALEKTETANTTETVVNFNNVDTSTGSNRYYTTVNGVETDPANVFYSYGKLAQKACGLVAYGDSLWQNAEWQNKYTWGQIAESDREFFLLAQPGTRFNLTFTDYNGHDDIAKALVGAGSVETTDDFAVKVYTAATKQDFANGNYTEHKMVPALQNGGNGFLGTYNFIMPEGHIYVRIVHPVSGAIGSVMKLDENGEPMEYAQANVVSNSAGNDWVHIKGITYTAPVLGTTVDDYKTNGWTNAHGEYHNLNSISGKYGLAQPGNTNSAPANVLPTTEDATNTPRTDAELAYAVYNVQPGTVFSADLFVRWGDNDWGKSKYDAVAAENGFEEFYFEFLGSEDGVTYDVPITTLGKTGDEYVKSTTKNDYNVKFAVPANVKYVKILSHYRGGYKVNGHWCVFDDNFAIAGVAFTPYAVAGAVTLDYNTPAIGVADDASASSSGTTADAEFNAAIGTVAAGQKLRLFQSGSNNDSVTKGLGIEYAGRDDATRAYAVYAVKPGTVFKMQYYINANNKKRSEAVNNRPFEFMVSSASTLNGTYTRFTQTNTHTTEQLAYSFIVPEDANFIKIEWPQSSGMIEVDGAQYYLNHDAFLRYVTYVPAGYIEGAVKYDYTDTTLATVGYGIDGQESKLGISSGTVGITFCEGNAKGLNVNYGSLSGKTWGTVGPFEVIYEVNPGSKFSTDLYLASGSIGGWNKETLAHLLGEPWEFTVSASATADGGWKNAVDTASFSTTNISLEYDVPADCKYVKITFPQRGQVEPWCEEHEENHTSQYPIQGNDLARICNVSYVPYGTAVTTVNDYTAKGEVVLDDSAKTAYEIYDFDGVIGTANGLTSEEGGYVIYKVSDAEELVVNTENELDIAVSYDGKNYVDAQISAFGGVYTVNTVGAKSYVKVTLDAGETITAVKAATVAPTATFINAAGTKEVVELGFYGETPVTTISTARAGYTFTGWDNTVEALYLDQTYTAQYDKAESKFDITVENGTIVSVAGTEVGGTSAEARFDDRVVIEAPATYGDLVFDKWVILKDGNPTDIVVSNSHKFSFLASGDLALIAEYAEAKSEIESFIYNAGSAIITDNGAKWNMSVTWSVNVPAGETITETGIILAATDTEMTKDAANTVTMKHSSVGTGKTLMYTVNNIADGATRYARPYAVLSDGTVIYGTTVTATDAQ